MRITADNPTPMTLDGTNTYVLFADDDASALLIDPGPELPAHRDAFLAAIGGRKLVGIVLTHQHWDHSDMLATIDQWAPDVPVYAGLQRFARHTAPVTDGQQVRFGPGRGDTVELIATPGHTADSISVLHGDTLYSGDTVLGRGTTVVTHPEGSLADYLDSLGSLLAMAIAGQFTVIEPAHGPTVTDPVGWLEYYVNHRQERIGEVEAVRAQGATSVQAIADIVYAEVPDNVRPAVEQIVRAQLEYLDSRA
ncbi:MBL fold metallo-hydrolase [Brevibacterium moorei]|uniref:MBL fold metallo-hydrolase n=1 Tax=Brevibacterium moorei TaxID=2968457 RepID=UPI00211C4A7B|nr:MBL fold metallo-hydrolase [Brevibacterium sp. 68QC2CO]MCQ9385331.1 MBL fold metallo-hydrolase [Brevibacterium sp. 68QC2CO]